MDVTFLIGLWGFWISHNLVPLTVLVRQSCVLEYKVKYVSDSPHMIINGPCASVVALPDRLSVWEHNSSGVSPSFCHGKAYI